MRSPGPGVQLLFPLTCGHGWMSVMSWYSDNVLPRCINLMMNTAQTRTIRRRVCAGLQGEVVEIGFGTGLNLPYMPESVSRLYAVEPAQLSVRLASDRIAASAAAVEVIGLDGQRIPLPDHSVDMALCTWTLCTIPDAVAAVREVGRVLKPGGALHFVEHGCSPDAPVRRWQERLNGVQNRLAGGCNLNRDIRGLLESGGLRIQTIDNFYAKGEPKPFGYLYEGVATAHAG